MIKIEKLSKAIIIFLFLSNCDYLPTVSYYKVGYIKVTSANFPMKAEHLNYVIFTGKIKIKGKINGKFFAGTLFTEREIEGLLKKEPHRIAANTPKGFSFINMVSSKGDKIDCFIKQRSKRDFRKGGIGKCYFSNSDKMLEIAIEP
jgi:hypothetical protein